MKKFVWAALLAIPTLAALDQRASAGGPCFIYDLCGCRIKFCPNISCSACGIRCGPSGGPSFNECCGVVPGPWYTFWPNGGCMMTSPYTCAKWMYDDHFQMTAPWGPAYPSAPPCYGSGPQFPGTSMMTGGYVPSYWYGH